MKTILTLGAGLAALVSAAACAQTAPDRAQRPMAPATRAEIQKHVADRFAKWDANRGGKVTKAEFDAARAARKAEWQGKREERRGALFARLDADKDGKLSQAEFASAHGPRDGMAPGMHRGMRHGRGGPGGFAGRGMAFERMDANKDGAVTLAEASARPIERFDRIDANHDGRISPEERDAARQARRAGRNA